MDKEDAVYMKYFSEIKNKRLKFATRINPEIIILSEVKSDTERQVSHYNTYMWNLKNMTPMNSFTNQTHRHRKQTYGYQRGKG